MSDESHHPHVLHVASGDLWAGAEVMLYTLTRTLNDIKVNITVALLNHGMLEDRLRAAGVDVHVFDEARLGEFRIILALMRLIHTEAIEVVHTHRIKENILGSIAALLAGGIPSMRTVHGDTEHWPRWWQLHKIAITYLDRLIGRLLQNRIISVSGELATRLGKHYQPAKITVIPNGIIIPKETPKKSMSESDPYRIGTAGRLVPVKRADLFLRTARTFNDLHPDIRTEFFLYGDGPLRSELERLNKALQTDNIVTFAGHADEMEPVFACLDVLVITSDHEGLPMILLEAMANGIPVVAHAVGDIPEVLDYGLCGVLVTDHAPDSYADAIFRVITDIQLRTELVSRALQRVSEHYTAEQNARRYQAVYQDLLNPFGS